RQRRAAQPPGHRRGAAGALRRRGGGVPGRAAAGPRRRGEGQPGPRPAGPGARGPGGARRRPAVTAAAPAAAAAPARPRLQLGKSFVHPVFDTLVIGGGLSLLMVAFLRLVPGTVGSPDLVATLPLVILFANSAHFAASTVRLYTKP